MHEAPTPQDKSPRRVRQMFAAVAPAYDRLNHVLSLSLDRLWRRRCARSLRGVEGPVLDLCCGTGDLSVALRRQGLEVVAADFCFPMVQRAGPKFGRFETSPPRPLTADALELPFADDSFDVSTCTLTLHHFGADDAVTLVREMARVTRGRVLVGDLERSRLNYLGARVLAATVWRRNPITRHDGPLSVLRSFTPDELDTLGRKAGLRDVRVQRHFPFRLVLEGRS